MLKIAEVERWLRIEIETSWPPLVTVILLTTEATGLYLALNIDEV